MLLRDRAVRACRRVALLVVAVSAAIAAAPPSALAADALLYRIFLQDGSTLVSYGDFARVADRVVFSIPIGGLDTPSPALHLVSIAESAVDWERTDGYAQATRARHYAATQGETDFDALSTRSRARASRRVDDQGSGAPAGARHRSQPHAGGVAGGASRLPRGGRRRSCRRCSTRRSPSCASPQASLDWT